MAMSENDEVIYHSSHADNRQSLDNIHRLVTLERSQKLDLLIHLINNLSQSLVVCGPEGIGKTTLLNVLQEHKQDHWRLFWTEGSGQLSFESLTEQCQRELSDVDGASLAEKLSQLDQRQQKLVWIVDNAGSLVPGLISALIQFAKPYDCLRLIFALTHDELHLKNSSDPEISECHLIEIPPLSQQHYTAFLQNLSAGQSAMISFNAINDGLVENLYRKTHGIPGKIIEELPRLSHYKTMSPLAWGSTLAIIVALAVGGGLLYLNKPETDAKKALASDISETPYKKQPVEVAISTPVIQHEPVSAENSYVSVPALESNPPESKPAPVEKMPAVSALTEQTGDKTQVAPVKTAKVETVAVATITEVSTPAAEEKTKEMPVVEPWKTENSQAETKSSLDRAAVKPVKTAVDVSNQPVVDTAETMADVSAAVKVETAKPVSKDVIKKSPEPAEKSQGLVWLESRNPKHFTLQIMVLTQLSGVKKLMKKYPVLQQKAQYFPVQRKGRLHYVVILGDYPSREAAENALKTLPKALAKAWIRSFKVLQQQTRS